jgi:hypothetical protein
MGGEDDLGFDAPIGIDPDLLAVNSPDSSFRVYQLCGYHRTLRWYKILNRNSGIVNG